MADAKPTAPSDESLRAEYSEISTNCRFFTSVRFALLTFATTLLSFLVATYQFVAMNRERFGLAGKMALFVMPIFGGFCNVLLMLLEERSRILYEACLRRGKKLEEMLYLYEGNFQKLWTAPLPWGMSDTKTIRAMYFLAIAVAILGLITATILFPKGGK